MFDSSPFSYIIISHTIGSKLKKLLIFSYFINTMYAVTQVKRDMEAFRLNRTFISVININRQGRGLELCKIDLNPPVIVTDRSKAVLLMFIFIFCVLSVCLSAVLLGCFYLI